MKNIDAVKSYPKKIYLYDTDSLGKDLPKHSPTQYLTIECAEPKGIKSIVYIKESIVVELRKQIASLHEEIRHLENYVRGE